MCFPNNTLASERDARPCALDESHIWFKSIAHTQRHVTARSAHTHTQSIAASQTHAHFQKKPAQKTHTNTLREPIISSSSPEQSRAEDDDIKRDRRRPINTIDLIHTRVRVRCDGWFRENALDVNSFSGPVVSVRFSWCVVRGVCKDQTDMPTTHAHTAQTQTHTHVFGACANTVCALCSTKRTMLHSVHSECRKVSVTKSARVSTRIDGDVFECVREKYR